MIKLKQLFLLAMLIVISRTAYSNGSDNPQVDSVIHAFMHKYEIPGGSFSMMYNRTLLYTKGYGKASISPDEPVTNASLFRIASCTKPFTSVALMQLMQAGLVHLQDKVFGPSGILNQAQYQTILDTNVLKITVENLLEHTGGWDDNYQVDPMFFSTPIAEWAGIPSPPAQETIIEYVLSQMYLIHFPGTTYAYSNFGYCVLGRVIEKITGMEYEKYVRDSILVKIGANSMQQGKSLLSGRFPNEVKYYGCPGEEFGQSVYDTNATVPFPYGAFDIEAMDSHGDWIASSLDLIKFLYAVHTDRLIKQETYNIMVTPPAVNPYYAKGWAVNGPTIFHEGSLPGTISEIVKAHNGYMWTLVFNKRSVLNDTIDTDIDDLGWTIQNFLLPPTPTDECPVTGPAVVEKDQDIIYSTGIQNENWRLTNYGADAHIETAIGNSVIVTTGDNFGSYTLYKLTGNNATVLCSLYVSVETALPVEMESFASFVNGKNVNLKWRTSMEQNNFGFSIQRSDKGTESWSTIGNIDGNGNSNTPKDYEYNDRNLLTGTYRYRLKQADYNGNFEYFNLNNEVVIGTPVKYFLSVNYPNPFNPTTTIDFEIPQTGNVKLTVFDISGKELMTITNGFREAGYYSVNFDGGMLSSGAYFYKLESGNFTMTRKMVLLK